jgi:pyruvate,water dikinase
MTQSPAATARERDPLVVIDLDSPTANDLTMVGSKAANLAKLRSTGLPVPEGVVVPADADASTAAAEIGRRFSDRAVAVRSSSAVEDLATASYAGQYTTVLEVAGEQAIATAIDRVRESASNPHRRGYRNQATPDMPVLVMPMVEADVAGVIFTTNPVTGDDELVIEAVAGLGEGLVSGEVTPQRWILSDEPQPDQGSEETSLLDAGQVVAITDLAEKVVALMGPHQDIEWAIADGELCLLQSRAITALPVAPDTGQPGPSEIWLRADEHYSGPVRPFEYSVWAPVFEETARKVFEELGAPIETMRYQSFGGWMYLRVVPPMDRGKDDAPPPPPFIFGLFLRLIPLFRAKMKRAASVWSSNLTEQAISDWESTGRDEMRERAKSLRARDREDLDDVGLLRHLDQVMAHLQAASDVHFRLPSLAAFLPMGHLGVVSEELLGWPPERVASLVQGGSSVVGAKSDAFAELVEAIRGDDEAMRRLDEDPVSLLEYAGPGGGALRGFLDEHGHELVGMDMTHPTWAEDPRPLFALVSSHLASDAVEPGESRLASEQLEHDALEVLDATDRENFQAVLDRARRGAHYGDETERDVLDALGLVRYAASEVGRRLFRRALLSDPDDLFFLDLDECRSAIMGDDLRGTVELRRRQFAWALAHPGPERYGPEPPAPPSMRYVPRPARRFMESMMWVMRHIEGAQPEPVSGGDNGAIRGIAASPGRVTGPARIVRDPSQFDRIRPGDVLVCPATIASWSVVFPVISGIVTERGGPLSHPGILAREYGIPAVLAVPGATSMFDDGETITVNGSTGTVET